MNDQSNWRRDDGAADEPLRRVAVVAEGLGEAHGVAQTLAVLRGRGIPGHELEVIADADALNERSYDLVHVWARGPVALAALATARVIGLPVVGSVHGELGTHAVLSAFYGQCRIVLSPSRPADAWIEELGVAPSRILRWRPGIDLEHFSPGRYAPEVLPDAFNVLYVGALDRTKGLELLAEAFLVAHDRHPRLRLILAGTGPDEDWLAARLGSAATFLEPLDPERLARVYATADLLVSPSSRDSFGHAILEAQASGLPVLAVDAGGPAELIEGGRSGCLVAPDADAIAAAIRGLARRAALCDRLATGGLLAVRQHTWERSLAELAAGYAAALGAEPSAAQAPEVARAA
jgi:glycosyltransferase involved in cell wall biosynthesis